LPSINVGNRQLKRNHANNTIFIPSDKKILIKTISMINNDKFYKKIAKKSNIFGLGNSSNKIIKVLKSIKINKKLFNKEIIY